MYATNIELALSAGAFLALIAYLPFSGWRVNRMEKAIAQANGFDQGGEI